MNDIKITFEANKNRSAAYDAGNLIGVCTYQFGVGNWIINHTEVATQYTGQGLARKLLQTVIEHARTANVKIIPECSYAAKIMIGKPEYADMLKTNE